MKHIQQTVLWTMAAFLLCAANAEAQKAERKHVREGNKLYGEEKYTESEIAYRKSLEVNPRSIEGTYNLGNALYRQQKFPEAAEQYQLIAGQSEKMKETEEGKARLAAMYHNVGNIGMQSKEYAKSVEAYKQSLRLNPKDDETRYNLALAQKMLKDQQQNQQNQDQQNQQKQEEKQDQQQNQQQNQNNDQQQQPPQQQKQDNQMSKENAEQLLNSVMQDEKDVQDKVKKQQQVIKGNRLEKDW